IKAVNTGKYENIAKTGGMVIGDAAANKLLDTIGKVLPERVAILQKLPISSPIFKIMTIASIIELKQELSKLPENDPQRETIQHELIGQEFAIGIMCVELFAAETNIEMAPVWGA